MKPLIVVMLVCILFSTGVFAQQSESVDAFISRTVTKTYDCPDPALKTPVDDYLARSDLSFQQRQDLHVLRTHLMICRGDVINAQDELKVLVQQPKLDKKSRYYAMAIYQIGFTYDFVEKLERCDYYQQAAKLANDRHSDIDFSANLNLISKCNNDGDPGQKLGRLYGMLEAFSEKGSPGELAQLYNNIGIMYAQFGQHVLAAEQYSKAHKLGVESAVGSNKLTFLVSVVSSYMASGMYDEADAALQEFTELNQQVGSPLTYFYEYFLRSGYYYRTKQFDLFKASLEDFNAAVLPQQGGIHKGLRDWYNGVACLVDKDLACLRSYVDAYDAKENPDFFIFSEPNKDHGKFMVDAYLALNDIPKLTQALEVFTASTIEAAIEQQASGKVLGVANLFNQVSRLENDLGRIQLERERVWWFVVFTVAGLLLIIGFIIRAKHREKMSIDPVTQFYNSRAVIAKIDKVNAPSKDKTNALAIFDLGNFKEVNRRVGSSKGDYVLKELANTLRKITRESDILGRFAPEQFILCLTDIEEEIANTFFERIQEAIENTSLGEYEGNKVTVRSSMAIFVSQEKIHNVHDVLDQMLLSLSLKNKSLDS